MMLIVCLVLILVGLVGAVSNSGSPEKVAHFTLGRRGGRLASHENVDLDAVAELIRQTEGRYSRMKREVKGNKIARRWRSIKSGTADDGELLSEPGRPGRWFFNLEVGDPPQMIQADLDMLSPDFYTLMTTSGNGSQYNSFSRSHVPNEGRVHPLCELPSDTFHITMPDGPVSIPLLLPMCSPSKSTRHTLGSSGSVVGLAPSITLARLSAPSLLQQLFAERHVDMNLFSLTLADAQSGTLSFGGTTAQQIEEQKTRFQVRLDNFGNPLATPDFIDTEVRTRMSSTFPPTVKEQFRWVEVHAAEGWWTTLMGGVWINGAKIISDQPVLFDIQSPFVLAPPAAARRFYQGIHATKRLPKPNDNMFAFPCLNQPNIAFEFARWIFPTLSGDVSMEERFDGPLGGQLSLGKLRNGTGYCLGAVVETRMGVASQADVEGDGMSASDGLRDFWVIGEPFFRGTGVVFDLEGPKIGFRTY